MFAAGSVTPLPNPYRGARLSPLDFLAVRWPHAPGCDEGPTVPGFSLPYDAARLAMFNVVRVTDPAELDSRSGVSDRFTGSSRDYRYRLQDRALWRTRFDTPIFSLATRSAGAIVASYGESRFATEVAIEGEEGDFFCFTTLLQGSLVLREGGATTTSVVSRGLAFRPGAHTHLLASDDSLRTNVFLKVTKTEEALEQMLDKRLRKPLHFAPSLDWNRGLAASLKLHLDFVLREFGRPDGVADNAVALASTTDLLMTLILHGLPHNHTDQLQVGPGSAVPVYVQRAEEFMRVHCAEAVRLSDIAAAAGCSVRTLGSVFQRFRGRTPLAALHAIRLERVRAELGGGTTDTPIAAVARRYGFTNASRFGAAFRRRFGETPLEVVRRASRRT
jgi:AraC-like DNA-binding protein